MLQTALSFVAPETPGRRGPVAALARLAGAPAPRAAAGVSANSAVSAVSAVSAAAADAVAAAGFEIGRDYARAGLVPPLAQMRDAGAVRLGWNASRAAYARRRERAAPAQVRRWLELRLAAWREGCGFEDFQVQPRLLARIDVSRCPVRGVALRDGETASRHPDDAVVVRLNPAAAYAAGNLATVSRAAAQAREGVDCLEALAQAERLDAAAAAASLGLAARADASRGPTIRGLDAAQWRRLAVLGSFATPLPHGRAATLPLVVLPPNRVRVLNPVQALQVMLTLQFTEPGLGRRLDEIAALVRGDAPRQALRRFMHTLLARRLTHAPDPAGADADALRRTLEGCWADPLVQRRWERFSLALAADDCERIVEAASAAGLAVGGGRWIDAEQAVEGWALPRAA